LRRTIEHVFDMGELEAVVARAEVPGSADGLVRAAACLDRLTAAFSAALAEFDRSGGAEADGGLSTVGWLRHRCAVTGRDAARLLHTARRARSLPVTAAGWRSGSLSGGQVQAIAANLD